MQLLVFSVLLHKKVSVLKQLLGFWHKHIFCPNESIFVHLGYDCYFMLSLFKFLRVKTKYKVNENQKSAK